jgi:copper chaperone CopZ
VTTTTTTTIAVKGMHCSSCGMLIDETLEELEGVASASTDLRRETTTVEYDPAGTTLEAIVTEITGLGYKAEIA